MAGSGGSGRKKSGGSAAAASKNHAAASNTLSLDNYFTSSAKKDKSNSTKSNATSSTPTFNPDQAARRMMGQETPQRNNQPAAAAAAGTTAHGSTSTTASPTAATSAATSASTSPAVNPNRAAIERARQGKASHKHRGSSPSKNSRKRQKSSTSTSLSSASSSSASSSQSGSPRGGASKSPTRSPTSRKNSSSSSSKTPTPAKKGPTIDLSMDSDEDHTAEGNAANAASASASASASAKPAASKSAGATSTAGKKRKSGLSGGGDDNGGDDGVFVIDDGDDNENRINGSEDSTLAKQQAKQQQRKRSKKGLGNVAGPTRGGTARSEVIDMAKSIDEDDDDEVVEVAAASAGAATTAAAAPTGKRKRGGVKSKVNNGTAAAAAKKPAAAASVAAQSIPAAASSDSDVVMVPNTTTTARSSTSTTAQASPPAAAASAATSAAASGASSPAVSNEASSPLQIAVTDETHGLALVRIDRVAPATSRESIDLTPEARDNTANFHPLRIKAVLGRTGTNSNNQPANKIDLGIGNGADGVSRRQVRVKHISVQGLVVSSNQHSRHRPQIRAMVFNTGGTGARIFVGVAHYGPAFRYSMYRAGSEFLMNVGDCLVFDAYNGSTTGGRKNDSVRPAHVFRLVRYDKRDASQAGASPPSDPAPAPALVTDSTAGTTPPITAGAAKRSEDAPISNSAAVAGRTTSAEPSVPPSSRSRKTPAARKDQNPSDPPHIPASAESTPRNGKVVDTADIDKTVPRLGMPNIVVASMTERREGPAAAAKPAENSDDKIKSDDAPSADVPSPETSNTESAATAEPTTKKPSSKRKENATKLPPQPSVGDRFQVNFEELKNFFGVVETQWFCGTVEEVSSGNNKYEVNVRYDDGGIGRHEYPADDVGRLVDSKGFGAAPTASLSQGRSRRKTQADDSSQSMERVESTIYPEGSKEAVFEPNPSELFVGDLVDCYYQNGKIDGAWYRGRVARVQISSEAGKPTLFDVAYNDQEYEKDIPLEHGNVRLFQRGSDDLSWLYGADVLRRLGRSKNATKVGTVKSSPSGTTSSMPKVMVELNDGTFEEHVYTDIAQELFATYLQFVPASKVKVWPAAAAAANANTGLNSVKIELPETNENEEPAASDDEENDDLGITKSKGTTRKTNAATFTSTQLDEMLNDHEASQDSQQSYPDSPVRGANDKPRAKEMHSSMANALWSALNSAEPSSSAILLRHSVAFHHTLPNSALSQKTFNLMMTGPQNEGISFRNPNRMELAYDYMRLCLTSSHRLDVGPNITPFAPSCWEDVQHILAQPLQETEQMGTFHSIKESESTSAMRRLGEALHTAASGLSCIDELLKDELSDGKEAGTTSNPRRLYMVNPTVRTALDANVREALKVAVRDAAQCWVRHGHFVIGDGDDLLPAESADEDWCAMEAKRCLDSLGSIISHLSWLYCAEEGIELSDNDCSFIICDALRNELESLHQDSADFGHIGKKKPSVASWKKYSKRAKMWFILSLDNSFASPLQQNLAKMLSLSKDLKPLL